MNNIPLPLQATAAKLAASIAARRAHEGPVTTSEGSRTHQETLKRLKTSERQERLSVRVVLRREHQAVDEVAAAHQLADGPRRLWELLHRLALDVAGARGYMVGTSQVVLHQAQELLAAALGVHRVTVWRWADELQALGLLQRRQHFTSTSTGKGQGVVTRADGTLFAVSLRAGHRARLRFDDLKARHRDLDAARRAGNTAFAVVQQSKSLEELNWYSILRDWAVNPDSDHLNPLKYDRCTAPPDVPRTVPDVVYALGMLRDAHASKRAALVGVLGSALSHALGDTHSRRYWCGVIWAAWREECEGRQGLQVLGAQLARLHVDMREWGELKKPAALFAARSRGLIS